MKVRKHCVICGKYFILDKGYRYKCKSCTGKPFATPRRERRRYCSRCGKLFDVKEKGMRYYCSEECREAPPEAVKQNDGLADVALRARREHMSYGTYVAKHGL